VDNFTGTDGCKVTVTLIGEYGLSGTAALYAGSNSGGAAMGSLQSVNAEILVSENGAADRANANSGVQHAQLFQHFCYQLLDYTVVAAGAVMQFNIGQTFGLFIYNCNIT
jgi:hypothetical protein